MGAFLCSFSSMRKYLPTASVELNAPGGTFISSFLCGGDNLVPIAVSSEVDRWHQAVIK